MWAVAKARVAQWDRHARAPERIQTEILLAHCKTASATEVGRSYELGSVKSYDDFRNRVPLRSYADYEPQLQRMRRGERDVLWPGLIRYFGNSSGTSHTVANAKFLPISEQQIKWQQKAGLDCIGRYLTMYGDRTFTRGFILALMPPSNLRREGEVMTASNPGIMQLHMPPLARRLVLPRAEVRDIEIYDRKLQAIAETYLDHDIRALSGTTCWFSILFDRVLAAANARGRRARTVSDIWPNLSVLLGGGVFAEPYRAIIAEKFGRPLPIVDTYNATEGGIFAASDKRGDDAMLMIPDRGVFFEFVARADHGKPDAKREPLWGVQPGVDYSVVVTTSSGLFGYYIGDFVRFTSVFPHRMVFAGRASGMLSITQELTTQIEIERAVASAQHTVPCGIVEYSAAAEVGTAATGKGRYLFFVEFERPPHDLDGFAAAIDRELCAQNRVYREHRASDVAILAPKVVPLGRGATERFMAALGQTNAQNKFPRIVDDRRRDLLRRFAQGPTLEVM
ncbi:MAG TPA: GH3 auxin-responsive promoter family protein [Kofleriaceae bacterium]|nr:GH3 auxin-responsive promoter family protein [Kofleriaceae bacterium]